MESEQATEAVLIRRAREGDADALQVLFDRYEASLRARIRAWLSPALRRKLSISDVLQEAYLVALKKLAEFEPRAEGGFARWLGRIAEWKARALVRRYVRTSKRDVAREVSRGGRCETANFAGRAPTPSQVAIAEELKEAARGALGRLPEDYREILRLVQEEHLTFAQAARRMGRSLAAARKLYGRALARLEVLLDLPKETQ